MRDEGRKKGIKEKEKCKSGVEANGKERRDEERTVKAVFFKQIRFGEIGLSLQDSDDLHLSITWKERWK